MDKERFQQLLAKAKATLKAKEDADKLAAATALGEQVDSQPSNLTIDLSKAGITAETLTTDAGEDAAVEVIKDVIENISGKATHRVLGVARDDITLNNKQQEFNALVQSSKDCVLIGAAGTGKTTSMRQTTKDLVASNRIKELTTSTKWLSSGKPGAAILSYTRKAVNNIRHAVAEEFKSHTLTIHKLLEFEPEFYQIEDTNNPGQVKNTMQFIPRRNRTNPLPPELELLVFEESSMISVELYEQLCEAMPHKHQEIFLGDIQQLPPIFGLAILGFKMNELPVVELTEVYRQALESPIIDLAWKLLGGNPHEFSSRKEEYTEFSKYANKQITKIRCPKLDRFTKKTEQGEVRFQIWQKRLSSDLACNTFIKQVTTWEDQGYFDAENDIILCPFNKAFGTVEINNGIMQHLGKKRGATVYEVIAGFRKHYLAVGDRVLYDKEDAVITDIRRNGEYMGIRPQTPSKHLDRWGAVQEPLTPEEKEFSLTEDEEGDIDFSGIEKWMETADLSNEERVQAASHVITIEVGHSGEEVVLDGAAQVNNLLGGYAITIHKAQGSEYDNVFLVLHDSHAAMVSRELLYTAITRAKKFLHIICETNTFEKGIKSQRIKGNTIAQKAEFFKGEASKRDIELKVLEKMTPKKVAIEDICPPEVKQIIQNNLDVQWDNALLLFPGKNLGEKPKLSFNLRRKNCLGLASMTKGIIKINPVWAAIKDKDIEEEMQHVTLIHEMCHIIAYRAFKDHGHGFWWKQCMIKMGVAPERLYTGDTLPPWVETRDKLAAQLLQLSNTTDEPEVLEEGEMV